MTAWESIVATLTVVDLRLKWKPRLRLKWKRWNVGVRWSVFVVEYCFDAWA